MAEPDVQGSLFWRFSLRFYRAPGVADACIALQDGYGVDVNILLFLLWLACEGRQVTTAEAQRICTEVGAWRAEVVVLPHQQAAVSLVIPAKELVREIGP